MFVDKCLHTVSTHDDEHEHVAGVMMKKNPGQMLSGTSIASEKPEKHKDIKWNVPNASSWFAICSLDCFQFFEKQ